MKPEKTPESVRNLVLWLLENAADQSSSEKELGRTWKIKRTELRRQSRVIGDRLDLVLRKRKYEVAEDPHSVLSFVLYGSEDKTIEVPGLLLSDGTIIDEIYEDGKPRFLVWKDGNCEMKNSFQNDGITYLPIEDELLAKGKVLLPSGVEEYGSAEQLLEDMVAFIERYVEADQTHIRLAAVQKLTEWLYEKLPVLPILNPRGGSDTGKTRIGTVLWHLSFRGMRADGVLSLSSLFRNAEKWRGTLYVNEADIQEGGYSEDSEATQLIKFYNSRYERDAAVWRTDKETLKPEVFSSFGPTILVTRKAFRDDALESRCLPIPMLGRTRKDIPLNLPGEFAEEGQHLRNRLELFRLHNLLRFSNDNTLEFEGVSTRMNQILQPMASLAKTHLPSFYPKIAALAKDLCEKVVEQRANSDDGLIVRGYFAADPKLEGKSAGEIREMIKIEFGEAEANRLSNERIGRRARSLGFEAVRTSGGKGRLRLLRLTAEHAERLLMKYVPEDERDSILECCELLKVRGSPRGSVCSVLLSPSVPTVPPRGDSRDSKGRLEGTHTGGGRRA